MDLILRGSEYQDFLNCRKKWYYSWVEQIEPVRPDNKLFIGTVFHKWLENYYQNGCNKLQADMETTLWFNQQDTSGMEQTELDEMMSLVRGMAENYHKTYGDTDSKWKILATEVEFLVMLEEGLFMTGMIDLVYEVDGKIRFADHKTVSSISMYEEKSKMDRQISRYWWALKMVSSGIARIKKTFIEDGEEKTIWVRWDELIGKEIDGFDYNLIAKDVPKLPKVLKNGDLSKDKSQKTTYDLYLKEIRERDLLESYYEDILEVLANKPDPFLRRINVVRTDAELEASAWEFAYTASDIGVALDLLKTNMAPVESITYRNIGQQCETMCQFRELCKTTIEGGNVSLVKNLAYRKKEEK